MRQAAKLLIARLMVMPRETVFAGCLTIVFLFFVFQVVSLLNIQSGQDIDDSQLIIKSGVIRTSGMSFEQIAELHLFGQVPTNSVAPLIVVPTPKTYFNLVLVGAMAMSDAKESSALIQVNNQTERFYVGDALPDGATLHNVLHNSVVLKRGESYETLLFPGVSYGMAQGKLGVKKSLPASNLVSAIDLSASAGRSFRDRMQGMQ